MNTTAAFTTARTHIASVALAAVLTLGMLTSIATLASVDAAMPQMAQATSVQA
jgi:hypothetical protein